MWAYDDERERSFVGGPLDGVKTKWNLSDLPISGPMGVLAGEDEVKIETDKGRFLYRCDPAQASYTVVRFVCAEQN